MEGNEIWNLLSAMFGKQKALWEPEEREEAPGVTDKLLHYVMSYVDRPAPARTAIRSFVGLGDDLQMFGGWNEVRVSTVREISSALTSAGINVDTWELAENIRDFLNYTWKHLSSLDLNAATEDNKSKVIEAYLADLPLQPKTSGDYLKVLWGRTKQVPYEAHTDRILCRLGVVQDQEFLGSKAATLQKLVGEHKPLVYHRKLLQLAKTVCLTKEPRCGVCPLNTGCEYARQKVSAA